MPIEIDLATLPAGARRLVEAGDLEIAVFNVDGRIYALGNRCPHRGGPLIRGALQDTETGPVVRCPMHGWSFSLATGESARPGRATVYPVQVRGGVVSIAVEAEA